MSQPQLSRESEASLNAGISAASRKDLASALAAFPRIRLGHLPTPLEPMDRLSEHLGGPRFWVKRDDCTGLSSGGNKTRKLEYLMAEAIAEGADTVITQGATQSNHARQTAAAAARLGLKCHILLEDRTGTTIGSRPATDDQLVVEPCRGTIINLDVQHHEEHTALTLK